jgi:hypothetical protein
MLLLSGFLGAGCSAGTPDTSADLREVDDYLEKWDRFARGESQLFPYLRANKAGFEAALTRLLRSGDVAAPARMVFYPIVQVGGFIPVDSELGASAAAILGPGFPMTTRKDGQGAYFGGELYFWWEDNQKRFGSFPLFDEWKKRELTQSTVIPFYRKICKRG